jgi:hypothetical protein
LKIIRPQKPKHLPEHAELCLTAVANAGFGNAIALGGAFGLLHYLDYRLTHDVDAWWQPDAPDPVKTAVMQTLERALQSQGEVRTRRWGEVVSVELWKEGRAVFSFQIAQRSALLKPAEAAPWVGVGLDSLADLVASKMVALVERGAPRDFRDIYTVCTADLASPEECWDLWDRRQNLAQGNPDRFRARLAIETHLQRICLTRPIDKITDPQQRAEALRLRHWYRDVFLSSSDSDRLLTKP